MTQQKLIAIAEYYINNDISLADLAALNGISKTTLVRYFKGDQGIYLPKKLQDEVDAKKQKKWIEGKATYGNEGKISFTKSQLVLIANMLIENQYTLREMANTCNVSPTTIYNLLTEENIGKDLYQKVTELYNNNKSFKKKI